MQSSSKTIIFSNLFKIAVTPFVIDLANPKFELFLINFAVANSILLIVNIILIRI